MTKILNTLRVTGTGSNYQALGVTGGYLVANSAVVGVNGLPSSLLSIVGASTASYFDISNGTSYLLRVYGTYSYFSNNVMIGNTTSHYGRSFQISTTDSNAVTLISSTDSYTYPISGGPTYGWGVVKHNEISFINTYYGLTYVVAGISVLSDGHSALTNTSFKYGSANMVFSIGVSSSNTLGFTNNSAQLNGEKMRITPDRGIQIYTPLNLVRDQSNVGYSLNGGLIYIYPSSIPSILINGSQQNVNLNTGDLIVNSGKGSAISVMNESTKTNYFSSTFYSSVDTGATPGGGFGIRNIGTRGFISALDRGYGNGSSTQSVGYAYRGGFNPPEPSLPGSTSVWTMVGFESSGVMNFSAGFTSSFNADIGQVIDFRSRSWLYNETVTGGTYSWGKIYTRYGLLIDYNPSATYSYANPLGGTITDRRVGTAWGVWVGHNINNYFGGRTLYGDTADDGTSLVQIAGTLSSQNILLTTNTPTTNSSLYSVIVRNSSTGRLETLTASLSSTASVSGTGSTNYLAIFNSSSTISQSLIYQGSTNKTVVIGYTTSLSTYDTDTNALRVKGDVYFDNISNKFNIGGVQLFDNTNSNIALGNGANNGGTAGAYNVALGYSSLMSNQTGMYNVGVGFNTLQTLTAGSYNMAVGANALYNNKGSRNTSIGYQSGYTSTGDGNTFIGNLSGTGVVAGDYNTFIGGSSSWTSSIPSNYVVITDGIGNKKLVIDNTNAAKFYGPLIDISGSTGLGGQVLSATSGGFVWVTSSNTLSFIQGGNSFGATANLGTNDNNPLYLQTNNNNIVYINTDGTVGIGTSVTSGNKLLVNGTASVQNMVIGGTTLINGSNLSLGTSAGVNAINYNIAIGYQSLMVNANSNGKNISIGYQAGASSSGYDNIMIGHQSGYQLDGSGHIAIGDKALYNYNNIDVANHAVGYYSLLNLVSGQSNHSYGDQSMKCLSSGNYNTSLGGCSMQGYYTATYSYNTAVGYYSLHNISTGGNNNIAIGANAASDLTTGSSNIVISSRSGNGITTGSSNVLIGNYLASNTSNYIYLADGAGNLRMRFNNSGYPNIANLPGTASGLTAGDLWKDSNGFLRVV